MRHYFGDRARLLDNAHQRLECLKQKVALSCSNDGLERGGLKAEPVGRRLRDGGLDDSKRCGDVVVRKLLSMQFSTTGGISPISTLAL